MKPSLPVLLLAAAALSASAFAADAPSGPQWVSGWGTSLDLAPAPMIKTPPPPEAVLKAIASGPQRVVPFPDALKDETVRMEVQTTADGRAVRIQLANAFGRPSVTIDAAHIALRRAESAIDPASDKVLTFGGKTSVDIPQGAVVVSDPAPLAVRAGQELSVSLHLPGETGGVTAHALGLNSAYVVSGDATAAPEFSGARTFRSYLWLAGLEVLADRPRGVIVGFGDSITDGFSTTPGTHRTWPEVLAARLRADRTTAGWSVVNMGISGNRIRRDGTGASALARFDRDVLSRPGVKWIVMLEGINDINMTFIPGMPDEEHATAEEIIDAYGRFVDKAHLHGIKVMGATLTPDEGLWLYTPGSEAMRQAVNTWIRTSGKFDAVVDFDRATRDPEHPARLRPDFDSGDHIHPNDAGTAAMAEAVNLAAFR